MPAANGSVVGAFFVLGVFWGTWAVALADVKRTFSLSDGALGILLAVAIGIAGVTGAIVGHYAERWGTARMLTGSLVVWSLLLVAAGVAPGFGIFAMSFAAVEVAGGCVDTAMNAAAAQRLSGRPGAMVRFHALFNSGALVGAAVAGVALHSGVSWRWLWPSLAVLSLGLAGWTWISSTSANVALPPLERESTVAGAVVRNQQGPFARLRSDGLLLLLFIFAIAEITEGGVDTWGVLYLRTHLASGVLLGAGAYVVGQSVAATTRGAGGPLIGRLSVRYALMVGGFVAGSGILIEALSPGDFLAACGLAIGAGGASLFWPLVISETQRRASQPIGAVGAFTAAGYMGWVAGAPIVGWVADTWGLNRGLIVIAVLAFMVALAAAGQRGAKRAVARAG